MRITSLKIPTSKAEAATLGCESQLGLNDGSGLSGLLSLLNFNLQDLVSPSPDGTIPSLLIGEVSGWDYEQTDQQVAALGLRIYGLANQTLTGSMSLSSDSVPVYDATASINCDQLSSSLAPLHFDVPLLTEEHTTRLALQHAHLTGKMRTNDLSLERATLNGYLSRADLREVIVGLQTACSSETPPELCGIDNPILEVDADALVDLMASTILGGFDSRVDNGVASTCAGPSCNAVSVCIAVETESVAVRTE